MQERLDCRSLSIPSPRGLDRHCYVKARTFTQPWKLVLGGLMWGNSCNSQRQQTSCPSLSSLTSEPDLCLRTETPNISQSEGGICSTASPSWLGRVCAQHSQDGAGK